MTTSDDRIGWTNIEVHDISPLFNGRVRWTVATPGEQNSEDRCQVPLAFAADRS